MTATLLELLSPAALLLGADVRAGWSDVVWPFFGLAMLAGVGCLAWWVVVRVNAARGQGPGRLFASLCQAHGLSWSDRRLLRTLAHGRGLADPARLFVEPRHFEAVSLHLMPAIRASRVADLRQRLFGE